MVTTLHHFLSQLVEVFHVFRTEQVVFCVFQLALTPLIVKKIAKLKMH